MSAFTNAPAGTIGGTTPDWNNWAEVAGLPAGADYDGNELADPAIYAPGTAYWQVLFSVSLATQGVYTWWGGVAGSINGIPVPADYDGDGRADPAVYHQDTGLWELFPSTQGYQLYWGLFGGGPEYAPVTE